MKKRSLFIFLSTLVFLLTVFLSPSPLLASWSGQPYSAGETLNPECGPTDENCTVVATQTWATTTSGIAYTGGHVGIGTTNTSNSSLTIQQSLGSQDIITNGSFSGSGNGWYLGDGWNYQDGVMKYTPPETNPTSINSANIDNGGTGYQTGDVVTISGGGNGDGQITVNQTWGGFVSLTILSAGSGYTIGDVVTVNNADDNYTDDATAVVDSVDGDGGITGLTMLTAGTNYPSTGGFGLLNGTGTGGWVTGNIGIGAIQYFDVTNNGTGYVDGTYNTTGGSGTGATLDVSAGNNNQGFYFLIPDGTPIEGHTYDVSLDVGGTSGQVQVCHSPYNDEGSCQFYDAGSGTHTFSFTWGSNGPFGPTALLIFPNSDTNVPAFNGTVDNISMVDQAGAEPLPGLTFVQTDGSSSLQLGLDEENGNGGQQHGFMIKTVDSNGFYHEASIYLPTTNNARYEYALPSLGENETDTFCFQNLDNCTATSTRLAGLGLFSDRVAIGTTTPNTTAGLAVLGGGGTTFTQVAGYETNTPSTDLAISGNIMFAADGNRLELFDISNPAVETYLSYYDFGSTVHSVHVVGNYAYVAVSSGFYVMDVSNPTQTPTILGSFESYTTTTDLQIQGNYVYLTDQDGNFYIVDISNPNQPTSMIGFGDGAYNMEGYGYDSKLVVSGNYVYIVEDTVIEIVDISDPTNPTHVSSLPFVGNSGGFDGGIALSGNYLYTTRYTGDDQSFISIDISDKNNPVKVGSANIGQWHYATDIVISGDYAYVGDGAIDSIYAITISDPTAPTISGYAATNGQSYGIALSGSHLFVADGSYGIQVFSIQNLAKYSALFLGGNVGIGTSTPLHALDVQGSINFSGSLYQNGSLFTADSKWGTATSSPQNIFFNTGFVGIGTSTPTAAFSVVGNGDTTVSFSPIVGYDVNTPSSDVAIGDNNVLYAANQDNLDVFDISNPANQNNLPTHYFGAPVNVIRLSGNIAYLGVGNYFYVMDISNPYWQAPSVLGSVTTDSSIKDIQIQGNYAYVIDQSNTLYVYDISNIYPGNSGDPIPVTTESSTFYTTAGYTNYSNLIVDGSYAYISEQDILEVVDISNPNYITHVSTFTIDGNYFGEGMALSDDGHYLYVTRDASDGNTFLVLDVSDKNNVHQVGSADIGNYRLRTNIVMHNGYAFVADGEPDSVYAINVSDPTSPRIVGHTTTFGNSYGLAIAGDKMFVADGNAGVQVFNVDTSGVAALFNQGKVGIGTVDPQTLLYVQSLQNGKQDVLTLASSFTNNDEGSALVFKDTNAPNIAAARIRSIAGMPGAAGLAFDVALWGQNGGAAEAMRISPFSGFVGIGTTSPVSRLANTSTNALDGVGTGVNLSNGITWSAPDAGYVISAINSGLAANANGLFVETVGTSTSNRILTLNGNGRDLFMVRGDGSVSLGTLNSSIGIEPVAQYGAKGGDLTISAGGGTAGANAGGSLIFKAGNANTGDGADHAGDIKLYAGANDYSEGSTLGSIIFYKGGLNGVTSESMRINSDGNVGIGTNNPTSALSVSYDLNSETQPGFTLYNSDAGNWPSVISIGNPAVMSRISAGNGAATLLFQAGGTGGVYLGNGATSWTSNSDARLKQNVTDLTSSSTLEKILALNPVSFNWIDPAMSSSTQYGFIAQDVLKVFPELVTEPKDPTKCVPGANAANDCYGLNYDRFGVFAIAAIKDIAGFSGVFKDNLISWLGNVQNGIQKMYVQEFHTNKLCVAKADGTEVCVTGDELEKITNAGSQNNSVINYQNDNGTTTSTTTPPTEENSGADGSGGDAGTSTTPDSTSTEVQSN